MQVTRAAYLQVERRCRLTIREQAQKHREFVSGNALFVSWPYKDNDDQDDNTIDRTDDANNQVVWPHRFGFVETSETPECLGAPRIMMKELKSKFPEALVASLGVSQEIVLGTFGNVVQDLVRRNTRVIRAKLPVLYNAFQNGDAIASLALANYFSPYLLARMLTNEFMVQEQGCKPLSKKALQGLMRDPSKIPDERLRQQVSICIEIDPANSPYFDRLREILGEEYEYILEQKLRASGACFQSEDDLRDLGMSKTPDVKLVVPVGLAGPDGELREINWIDSKAMFGSDSVHESNASQLDSYVNRFGPGAVIYWVSFLC